MSSADVVPVKQLVPFRFDRVCLSRGDALGHYVSEDISNDKAIRSRIAAHNISLVFFNSDAPPVIYGFKGSEKIRRSGRNYWFLHRFEGMGCAQAQNAVLEAKEYPSGVGPSYEIILSAEHSLEQLTERKE